MKVDTIKIADLRQVAKCMAKASLQEITVTQQGMSIRMRFAPLAFYNTSEERGRQDVDYLSPSLPLENIEEYPVIAVGPGYFLRKHPAHCHDYIAQGALVKKDELLGVVRMGEVYLPLYSHVEGEVMEVIATETPVEYGQTIALIKGNA